jgi:PIN domain nuclease of toxin-antitoxin system
MGTAEMRQAIRDLAVQVIPFGAAHAFRRYDLPQHHCDPFDRMLIATALTEGIPLAGSDRLFKKYKGLQVIW